MVDATSARATPRRRGLPEEIVIWEILVRLPPVALLRCHAVCRTWHHATSTRDFLLAHHACQPTLPLLHSHASYSLDITTFDCRKGLAAANQADQLQSVARLGPDYYHLEASCDGLLVLSINVTRFCICNPATRQFASLPLLVGFSLVGMYQHPPTGEYRLVVNNDRSYMFLGLPPIANYVCHIFRIGSGQPPRRVRFPDAWILIYGSSVLFHGSLHWQAGQNILAFDTAAESFREMRSPIVSRGADLFEIDGMLGMYNRNEKSRIMDIWVMHDYEGEVWDLKYRVELPIADIARQFEEFENHWSVLLVESLDGDVLVLVRFGDWLVQVGINGKLVASFHRRALGPTQLRLKQTLVSHAFFPTLEGYVVNASPFI